MEPYSVRSAGSRLTNFEAITALAVPSAVRMVAISSSVNTGSSTGNCDIVNCFNGFEIFNRSEYNNTVLIKQVFL